MYLLDTHVFLWAMQEPERLNAHCLSVIETKQKSIYLSAVSLWELSIKYASGKLHLKAPLSELFADSPFSFLPIDAEESIQTGILPPHHCDPFDRMLVAQSMARGLTLITRDRNIPRYEVCVLQA